MLTLDYTYMMADVVGERIGIADADLDLAAARTEKIHAGLMQAREQGSLPFYDLPVQDDIGSIIALAENLAGSYDDIVVLGIGGSALGTSAVARALLPLHHNHRSREDRNGRPRLFVLDNIDPAGFKETLDLLTPERTCFCVISKSGTTVETMSQFLVAREWIRRSVGDSYVDHFVLVTDPERGVLRKLADSQGYRSCIIPEGVGGRFSVFSAVGLLPLAAAGVDVPALLQGAASVRNRLTGPDLFANPAYLNATLQFLAYGKGARISVMMPYSDRLRDVADWYRQLWAESLGKKLNLAGETVHAGPTPVRALGATDQHSQLQLYMEGPFDKVVTFVVPERQPDVLIPEASGIPELEYLAGQSLGALLHSEQRATAQALARAGRANCTIRLDDITPQSIGALLFMFEVQTVFAGALFNVDPLDQPGVEAGKVITSALLGRSGFEACRRDAESWEKRAESKVLILD